MRAREFIIESNNIASAEQVWNYVGGIHPKDQQGGGFLKSLVMLNPQYELKRIPLSSLHIPDNPKDEVNDPYGRAMSVDVDHAREYSQHYIDKKPLVVDSQGHILDGAHRAWAAAELLNKTDIMAWVPVKSRSATPQDLELRKKFTGQGVAEGTEEVNPLTNAVISFYKPVVDQIEPGAVDDYVKQAKELLNKAPDPTIRSRMLEIFRKGQKDPMIQGGVVTAIAAILTGGLLSSASRMGLSPAQTNILLQAVLNTVIPTIIARINNKSWRDTIKYTLASVGVGMTAAATLSEKRVTEGAVDEMSAAGNFGNRIWYHGTSRKVYQKMLRTGVVKPFVADDDVGPAIWLTSDPAEAATYGPIVLAISNSVARNYKLERYSGYPHGMLKAHGITRTALDGYNMVILQPVPLKYWKRID